jgi:hypothetical protein
VLDFLNSPYQSLLQTPGIKSQLGTTHSASDAWGWRDIKRVDIVDDVHCGSYFEEFHQIFSLPIRDQPLAVLPPALPDIDLRIVSEKHAEQLLQKTVFWRVNIVLQMIYTILTSDENTNFDAFPRLSGRPVYSPGLRSGTSTKNNTMIPDLCCHRYSDIFQKEVPFLVGDVKLHRKWNSSLGQVDDNNDYEIWYRTALAQVNFYMVQRRCMFAFIITEQEFTAIERVPEYEGWLKVSKPFTGPRDMSIGLLGLCLRACSTPTSPTVPAKLKDTPPDTYYPKEETGLPSSSPKANPSSSSYSYDPMTYVRLLSSCLTYP